MTDQPVGYIDEHGNTKDATPEAEERVRKAFDRDLLVKDGEMLDELGMCFDGVCAVRPADPEHDALVLRNLGALSGLRPEPASDDDAES